MKLIKQGREQKGWAKIYECTGVGNGGGGCGAILLVEEDDFYQTSNTDFAGDTTHYCTFECMSCGVLTDVDDVPARIWRK